MKQIYLETAFKRGYRHLMKYISNIAHLDKRTQSIIYERIKIIEFYDEYGKDATKKAFSKSRSTVLDWKSKLKRSGGKLLSLKPESKAPKTRSQRVVKQEHIDFIRDYRHEHPGVDKATIKPVLDAVCFATGINTISESTIGRIIAELKEQGKIPNYQLKTTINGRTGELKTRGTTKREKKLRIKDYKAKEPGDLVQIDAITIFINGVRRYLITALDVRTRFSFAYCYKTLSSNTAKDFMIRFQKVAPFTITHIQTDNGSEFHKYFREYIKGQNIVHFYNYPRSPKMNSFIERFNRTIQDQHVSWNMNRLEEPNEFNQGLMKYLIWYNTEKSHRGIGKVPPLQYYINNYIQPEKSSMLWTSTYP
jgi:putative transposase